MQPKRENGVLRMVRWNFNIPPDAAHDFVADMRSYRAAKDGHQRDQIAAREALGKDSHSSGSCPMFQRSRGLIGRFRICEWAISAGTWGRVLSVFNPQCPK